MERELLRLAAGVIGTYLDRQGTRTSAPQEKEAHGEGLSQRTFLRSSHTRRL